jgi:hypothetical protein
VGLVVGEVALGQAFLRIFPFPLSISFHRGFPYSHISWGKSQLVAAVQRHEKQQMFVKKYKCIQSSVALVLCLSEFSLFINFVFV